MQDLTIEQSTEILCCSQPTLQLEVIETIFEGASLMNYQSRVFHSHWVPSKFLKCFCVAHLLTCSVNIVSAQQQERYKVFWASPEQADNQINKAAKGGYKLRSATMTQCLYNPRDVKSPTYPCVMIVMEK